MSKSTNIKIPGLGRVGLFHESAGQGSGLIGQTGFDTRLTAQVIRDGRPVPAGRVMRRRNMFWDHINPFDTVIDLGSGLVTNVGATALANEAVTLASPSGARINTLFLANQHATGTGVTAAAATDFKLQTVSTQGGQTPVAGTQTIDTTSTIAVPKYKTVATISYTGSEAVTEWGLHTSSTLSSTTGSNGSNTFTATTFTAGAGGLTASSSTVQGLQQQIVVAGTTTVLGLIQSNTTSVGTLFNNGTTGWFTQAAQTAGATPSGAEAYTLRPILWDHKVFSAINVLNGDSIAFTYSLQINSGG